MTSNYRMRAGEYGNISQTDDDALSVRQRLEIVLATARLQLELVVKEKESQISIPVRESLVGVESCPLELQGP
jgi:hypothetical protein